ncbi:MAG: M20/M25/M40 family metallo-hydrolase, partial [Planctomycetaceae bacterium]|nr:M20/M25/M40 family metallo-hydrolase [Planctomycetaceae bacterium]
EAPSAAQPERREVVVLGAHFDHLGVRGGGADPKKPPKKSSVFWGADDNASGTTAVLLVARALGRMAADGLRPRRSIVVAFFTGEEMGLLGSKHYVGSPVVPLADTAAMINLDMVGRNGTKAFEIYGNGSSPELDAWHREVLAETKLDCSYPPPALLQRSDQWSFYEAGIPVLFLHGGLHGDYHTPRDTADGLNYPKIALAARHALGILWKAANAPGRPGFRKIDMTGAGGRLGIAVDPATPEEIDSLSLEEGRGAVRVSAVFAGSMGERFFEQGDLIFSWNGFPIMADDPVGRFTSFLNMARTGDPVTIRYQRGKDRKAATVKF